MRNRPALMFPNLIYSLNNNPETRKPLNTKNKSTPIQPIFTVNAKRYLWRKMTNMIAMPRRKSISRKRELPFILADDVSADGWLVAISCLFI